MKSKIIFLLIVIIAFLLAGCNIGIQKTSEKPSAEISSPTPQEQISEPDSRLESSESQLETEDSSRVSTVHTVKELTVQKITSTQESVCEEVTFRLSLPKKMTVEYDNKTPFVMDGDTEYLRASSMSSGVTKDMIVARMEEDGFNVEKMNIGDYTAILVIEAVEDPINGFEYTYYILFDDDTVLPLTFSTQIESNTVKQEFNGVINSFELA